MKRVFLIGAHPPTIGGVSIHVQRLRERLLESGWSVDLFDPYSRASSELPGVFRLRRPPGFATLVWKSFFSPPSVSHIHLSHVRQRGLLKCLCTVLRKSRIIFTIHSGSFAQRVRELSVAEREDLRQILSRGIAAIAVNDEIADAVSGLAPSLIVRTIPPYLAPFTSERSETGFGFIASGYGTSIYGWETIIDAYCKSGSDEPLHLAFYNTYEKGYFDRLMVKVESCRGVVVHRDLSPPAFQDLLGQNRVFVRATDRDGDSVAVREALGLGLEVFATDVVSRPSGCTLFGLGDSAALCELMKRPARGKLLRSATNFFPAIEDVYGLSMTGGEVGFKGEENYL